jgi:hypothetical protein
MIVLEVIRRNFGTSAGIFPIRMIARRPGISFGRLSSIRTPGAMATFAIRFGDLFHVFFLNQVRTQIDEEESSLYFRVGRVPRRQHYRLRWFTLVRRQKFHASREVGS